MAVHTYKEAIDRLLAHEGGYTNHPADPGGPTNWGITIHDARRYWKKGATAADVKAMPKSVACDIYRAKYWDAQRCDALPAGLDYIMFDYGVNSGIGRSGKVLRRICGMDASTSTVSDSVLAQVSVRNPEKLINAMCDERLRFLMALRTWPVFGKGWGRRVSESRAAALKMAKHSIDLDPAPKEPAQAKATPAKSVMAEPATAAKAATVAPVAAAATAAAGYSTETILIVAAVVLIAVAVVAGYFIQRHRHDAEAPMPLVPVQPEGIKS